MAVQKRNSAGQGQRTISFARQARRPGAGYDRSSVVNKGKLNTNIDNKSLYSRVQHDHPIDESKAPDLASIKSPKDVEKVLNGTDSKSLLKEWRQDRIESPRFHQNDMSTCQQLLRQFDMIQEYGPCQGLTRVQRWNRAQKLGKNPPLHIKAVLDAAKSLPQYSDEYEMSVFGKLH